LSTTADVIIVGQGLAGTALAWTLLEREISVLIADAGLDGASRVAAGLVTPVTGQALRARPTFPEEIAVAAAHYKSVESAVGQTLWHARPSLRIAQNAAQAQRLAQRLLEPSSGLSSISAPPPPGLRDVEACGLMTHAARLDVAAYVTLSAEEFRRRVLLRAARADPADVTIKADGHVEAAGLRGRHRVWGRGFQDYDHPWRPAGALSPAKGEIIDIAIRGWQEPRTVHSGGHWLLPRDAAGSCSFGATYDHADLDPRPTTAARQRLKEQLAGLIHLPFDVTGQRAGIRPIGARRQPVTGPHPVHKQILTLNGLGSKGVLWAPAEAAKLCAMIMNAAQGSPA